MERDAERNEIGSAPIKGRIYPGYLTIDLSALRRNFRKLAALAGPARVAGVVKADAYGLGALRVANALLDAGCRDFFVAHSGEAMALKPHLPATARLFVLNGVLPGEGALFAAHDIVPVINSPAQFALWRAEARARGHRLPAILQFDTGMSRLGFAPSERAALREDLRSSDIDVLYVMSHLASADEPEKPQNAAQLAEMLAIAAAFAPIPVCFANSGGAVTGGVYHGSMVRPGIAVYGGAPHLFTTNPMEPVVRLAVSVVQTRTVPEGTLVGYGGTFRASGPMRLATLCAGYADGLPRSLGGQGAVYFDGCRLPIVGRVSMDSMTIDISALPDGTLDLGSVVEVIGPHQTLERLAEDAGTIAYEILTRLGPRFHRDYRGRARERLHSHG